MIVTVTKMQKIKKVILHSITKQVSATINSTITMTDFQTLHISEAHKY